ncbi:MAG: YciC family protein [Candidatus Krumholzibacteriales bacterium]
MEVPYSESARIVMPPGAGKCYSEGWGVIKRYFIELFLVTLLVGLFWSVGVAIEAISDSDFYLSPIYGLFYLGYLVLIMGPVEYGKVNPYLKAVRSQEAKVKDIFVFQEIYLNAVLASALTYVIIGIGFLFFIIPGIILACKLAFVPYLVVDRRMDAVEAIKKSWKMTAGYAGTVFLIGLLAIPVFILGILVFFVGVLVASMWVNSALAYLYNEASRKEKMKPAGQAPPGPVPE